MGLMGAILSQNMLYATLAITLFIFTKDKIYDFERTAFKEIIKYSVIIGATSVLSFLYTRVDVIILKQFGFLVEIGYYEIVNRIFTMIILPFFILGQVIAPNITKAYAQKKFEEVMTRFRKHLSLTLALGVIASLALLFLGPVIIKIIFSKYFTAETIMVLQLLLLTLPLKAASATIAQGHTNATGNANISLWTMIPAGIGNVVLDIIFIKEYGFIGVVYSSIICFTFANISLIVLYNRRIRQKIKSAENA
jgi:O-antigen/teichoic acid export membrane protein